MRRQNRWLKLLQGDRAMHLNHSLGAALHWFSALAVAYDTLGVDIPWRQLEQCAGNECDRTV
ncbi:MAG TPA: hypothetical protein GXZ82_04790 [Firmicutes bacterium]|nr:hypothetical protein [Bacillota bacterium]